MHLLAKRNTLVVSFREKTKHAADDSENTRYCCAQQAAHALAALHEFPTSQQTLYKGCAVRCAPCRCLARRSAHAEGALDVVQATTPLCAGSAASLSRSGRAVTLRADVAPSGA